MVLELWDLAEHAMPLQLANGADIGNPQALPWMTRELCAALQPLMILFATVPRFYLNEFKWSPQNEKAGAPPGGWRSYTVWSVIGVLCWSASAVIWATCSIALTSRLWKDGDAPEDNMRRSEQLVVTTVIWLQIGYPIVSLVEMIWSNLKGRRTGDTYDAALSVAKDAAFATLDVLTKGGLAVYCASRSVTVV